MSICGLMRTKAEFVHYMQQNDQDNVVSGPETTILCRLYRSTTCTNTFIAVHAGMRQARMLFCFERSFIDMHFVVVISICLYNEHLE